MTPPVRVLVVEDDEAIRDGLVAALEVEGYDVAAASGAADAVDVVRAGRPAVAIVDVGLAEKPDGFALARRLRTEADLPVLFVTARGAIEDRLTGFEIGAEDYIVKPFSVPELLARLRVVLRRHGHLRAACWQIGALQVDEEAHMVRVGSREVVVTATEFELLLRLLHHRGRVLSKSQLLASIRGADGYDPTVVESHVSSLRRKLRPEADDLIETVRGYGYVVR